jgi:hypothetical protein
LMTVRAPTAASTSSRIAMIQNEWRFSMGFP